MKQPLRCCRASKFPAGTEWGSWSPAHSTCPLRRRRIGPIALLLHRCDTFPQGTASGLTFPLQRSSDLQDSPCSRLRWTLLLCPCTYQQHIARTQKHPLRSMTRAGTPSTLSMRPICWRGCRYPKDTGSAAQLDNSCQQHSPCTRHSRS